MYLLRRVLPLTGLIGAAHCYTKESDYGENLAGTPSHEVFPRQKWNSNWDLREPVTNSDTENSTSDFEEKIPTKRRNIILIRHGQYVIDSKDRWLTELGKEQAALIGERLAASGLKFTKLTMSTMNRATETANIILTKLPESLPRSSDSLLEEGAPYPPEPSHLTWKPDMQHFYREGSRIEAAFRKYIHRAPPEQAENSYEIIVCHGNVIRYFVCRALQFPVEGWLRLSLANCSLASLIVYPDGTVALNGFGDLGHIPHDKITYN
ncbi:unnamed protein product, partial [Mesorhabditis belari]|uniref:Serine/threonine-protein phosphatase PGAM5, mitochondrial n=1 Tax=Mesorhabditis belari TaxID=2138241 RepID=A0AAF3ERA7_9BILA